MKKILIIFIYVLSASLGRAEQADVYVELILDASGSMEEAISGKTKMQIAKDVLSKYAKNVNKDYNVGLRVYGNTKRKDCKDSHLIVPIAQNNRDQIMSEIKEVTALSMTPIGYSLQKAAEDLKPLKGKGTLGIVLVTDGQESCDLDPCKVAKEMIKSGLQLKVNVVGFDIKDKQSHEQLKCIANATGGTYVTSDNADSLYKMLEKSVEMVAQYNWNLRVEAPSSHQTYYLDVLDEKTGKTVLEHQYANRGYLLPDGVYTIKVNMKPEYVEKNIRLSQTKQTIIKVKGFGKLVAEAMSGHESIYITVKDSVGKEVVEKGYLYSAGHLLPEGTYTVEFSTHKGPVLWTKKDVQIKTDQTTEIRMAGFGTLVADAIQGVEGIYITVKDSVGKEVVEKGYTYSAGHLLPEGMYTVEFSTKRGPVLWTKKDVEIKADKTTEVRMTGFGKLVADAIQGVEGIYITVKDSKGEMFVEKGILYSAGHLLPEGMYTVEFSTRKGPVLWTKKDVQIRQDKTTEIQMMGFGKLYVKEPKSQESLYLTVKDSKGEMFVEKGIPYSAGYLLPIGKYTVELSARRGPAAWTKKDVEIRENKTTEVYFDK